MRHGYSDGHATDEGFIFTLLHRYPELQICNIFHYRREYPEGLIKDTFFHDTFPNDANNIDVGPGDIFEDKDWANREFLIDYFRGVANDINSNSPTR